MVVERAGSGVAPAVAVDRLEVDREPLVERCAPVGDRECRVRDRRDRLAVLIGELDAGDQQRVDRVAGLVQHRPAQPLRVRLEPQVGQRLEIPAPPALDDREPGLGVVASLLEPDEQHRFAARIGRRRHLPGQPVQREREPRRLVVQHPAQLRDTRGVPDRMPRRIAPVSLEKANVDRRFHRLGAGRSSPAARDHRCRHRCEYGTPVVYHGAHPRSIIRTSRRPSRRRLALPAPTDWPAAPSTPPTTAPGRPRQRPTWALTSCGGHHDRLRPEVSCWVALGFARRRRARAMGSGDSPDPRRCARRGRRGCPGGRATAMRR